MAEPEESLTCANCSTTILDRDAEGAHWRFYSDGVGELMPFCSDCGARIRRARREANLSHDKLGVLVGGVSRQHLIKLEKAKHRPRAEMLTKIAEATGRSVDWFLDPEVDPSPFPNSEAALTWRCTTS